MTKDEVRAFVAATIEAGSYVQAIGTVGYDLAEPVDPDQGEAYARIELVSEAFGEPRVVEIREKPDTGLV